MFNLKVRYIDDDLNKVRLKYFKLKNIINNPLLICNCYLQDIYYNVNTQTAILNFFNNK